MRSLIRSLALLAACLALAGLASAQSTFGTILGTVTDPSGSAVPDATVKITNTDENTTREFKSNSNGDYEAVNSKPGHYRLEAAAAGFQSFNATDLMLVARQTLRVNVPLQIGEVTESVTVEAAAGVITSETQTISTTMNADKLTALPGNVRAADSTSPYNLIALLPGVQADNGNNFTIQGNLPSQTQFSLDGISTTQVTGNSPSKKGFTSVEMISEIKVQAVGNSAEYGQSGDVTTISKSGTNQFHGAAFWYHQNRALDAQRYGALEKPQKVANDVGGSGGGPVIIPKLYNGRNKTFFFADFEHFTFPRGATIQNRVPTEAVRNGDFSNEGVDGDRSADGPAFREQRHSGDADQRRRQENSGALPAAQRRRPDADSRRQLHRQPRQQLRLEPVRHSRRPLPDAEAVAVQPLELARHHAPTRPSRWRCLRAPRSRTTRCSSCRTTTRFRRLC